MKAVLHQDDDEAERWGIRKKATLFHNILVSISDGITPTRKQRSPSVNNDNSTNFYNVFEQITNKQRPSARYGHAASLYTDGFVIYGGKLENGSLCNELWLYNVSENTGQWSLRAKESIIKPPALTRNTLTLAGDYLYLFGGSTEDGEFSSR